MVSPMPVDSTDLPRPFGVYTLLRRLAVGGMAEVYVAKTEGIGGFEKLVAIKVIHPRFSEDEHFIQMLVEEAKLSVLLTHANIAQTFDLGEIDGIYFIVMEFIEGADTYRLLKRTDERNVKLPLDVCAYVAAETAAGLDYAHRKHDSSGRPLNIVHRDISPQNILMSFSGEVKIVDFGIAKAALRTAQTEVGVIKGKYYYMSPEQAWADPVDSRSDIFSAGVVLYELLTGEMLYQQDNLPKLLDAVRKAEIPPPSSKRKEIPKVLDDIVMKAVARKPEDRYQSAHAFRQALTQFVYQELPTFTPARISQVMAQLFPNEMSKESEAAMMTSAEKVLITRETNLEVMTSAEDFKREEKSVIFDLSDRDRDDLTNQDVAAARRKVKALGRSRRENTAKIISGERALVADHDHPLIADDGLDDLTIKRPGLGSDPRLMPSNPDDWEADATVVEDGESDRIADMLKARQSARSPEAPVAKVSVPRPGVAPPRPVTPMRPPPPKRGPRAGIKTPIIPRPRPRPSPSLPPLGLVSSAPPSAPSREETPSDFRKLPVPEPLERPESGLANVALTHSVLEPEVEEPRSRVAMAAGIATIAILVLGLLGFVISRFAAPSPSMLEVVSVPSGAGVLLNGEPIGDTPISQREVEAGKAYQLVVSHPDFEPWQHAFQGAEGTTIREVAVLRPRRFAITIQTEPAGGQVWVDGVLHGEGPVTVNDLPLGATLTLRAVIPGRGEQTISHVLASDAPRAIVIPVPQTEEPAPTRRRRRRRRR